MSGNETAGSRPLTWTSANMSSSSKDTSNLGAENMLEKAVSGNKFATLAVDKVTSQKSFAVMENERMRRQADDERRSAFAKSKAQGKAAQRGATEDSAEAIDIKKWSTDISDVLDASKMTPEAKAEYERKMEELPAIEDLTPVDKSKDLDDDFLKVPPKTRKGKGKASSKATASTNKSESVKTNSTKRPFFFDLRRETTINVDDANDFGEGDSVSEPLTINDAIHVGHASEHADNDKHVPKVQARELMFKPPITKYHKTPSSGETFTDNWTVIEPGLFYEIKNLKPSDVAGALTKNWITQHRAEQLMPLSDATYFGFMYPVAVYDEQLSSTEKEKFSRWYGMCHGPDPEPREKQVARNYYAIAQSSRKTQTSKEHNAIYKRLEQECISSETKSLIHGIALAKLIRNAHSIMMKNRSQEFKGVLTGYLFGTCRNYNHKSDIETYKVKSAKSRSAYCGNRAEEMWEDFISRYHAEPTALRGPKSSPFASTKAKASEYLKRSGNATVNGLFSFASAVKKGTDKVAAEAVKANALPAKSSKARYVGKAVAKPFVATGNWFSRRFKQAIAVFKSTPEKDEDNEDEDKPSGFFARLGLRTKTLFKKTTGFFGSLFSWGSTPTEN